MTFPRDYRVNKQRPCPICGKPDWCLLHPHRLWAICMRVPNDRPTRNGGWFYTLGVKTPPPLSTPHKKESLPPDQILHFQYTALLDCCEPDWGWFLRKYNTAPDFVSERRPGWLQPYTQRPHDGIFIIRELPEPQVPVPGTYVENNTWRWTVEVGERIIPVYNQSSLVGFQIMASKPNQPKYRWLSSAGRQHGLAAISRLSCTRTGRGRPRTAWVTEGILKASVLSTFLEALGINAWVVGVPGAQQYLQGVLLATAMGPETVVLAPDRDWLTNRHVRKAVFRALHNGLLVTNIVYAVWPDRYKGLDDALAAEAKIRIRSWRRFYKEYWRRGLLGL